MYVRVTSVEGRLGRGVQIVELFRSRFIPAFLRQNRPSEAASHARNKDGSVVYQQSEAWQAPGETDETVIHKNV